MLSLFYLFISLKKDVIITLTEYTFIILVNKIVYKKEDCNKYSGTLKIVNCVLNVTSRGNFLILNYTL